MPPMPINKAKMKARFFIFYTSFFSSLRISLQFTPRFRSRSENGTLRASVDLCVSVVNVSKVISPQRHRDRTETQRNHPFPDRVLKSARCDGKMVRDTRSHPSPHPPG